MGISQLRSPLRPHRQPHPLPRSLLLPDLLHKRLLSHSDRIILLGLYQRHQLQRLQLCKMLDHMQTVDYTLLSLIIRLSTRVSRDGLGRGRIGESGAKGRRTRRVLGCDFIGFEKSERHEWIGDLGLGG